ncbi:MAG: hypothetical protein HY553_17160 [Elusimicrobia bacterium]|nr:hypothetical protein [Elusimicrobiota bacterium]
MKLAVLLALGAALVAPSAGAAPTAAVDATPGWLGDLAFDSTRGRWLVVSHAGPVHGRIMGNDGKPVTPVFTVSGAGQAQTYAPLAAYSKEADRFLVVWMDFTAGATMHGRWVSPAGVPGAEFAVPTADVPGVVFLNVGGDRSSALRYDSARKRFVLVWEHREEVSKTKLTTIDLEGRRGAVVNVGGTAGGGNWGPSVAVNEDKGEYCVAYDQRNTGRFAVSPVNAATLAVGPESTEARTTTNVDIAYNEKTKRYLLIYDAGYSEGVKGRVLGSCGLGSSSGDRIMLARQGYSSAAANPKNGTYAAIGQDGEDFGNFYSVVNGEGKITARSNPFPFSAKGNFLPVIRANTNDGTYAATSSRDYAMTRFVAKIGSGEGVEEPAPTPSPEPEMPASMGWIWHHPDNGGTVDGTAELEGEATHDVAHVDILVNLHKVGEAHLTHGRWRYALDTSYLKGGVNLSALIKDAHGNTARYTIRINVPEHHPRHHGVVSPN